MVQKTVKKKKVGRPEVIYRCPFCSKKPKISYMEITNEWVAVCSQLKHYVYVQGSTRKGVIRRWNGR